MIEKIRDKRFIVLLVLLTYLKPYNVTLIPWLNAIYLLLKVFATIMLFIYMRNKKIKFNQASKFCIAFLICWTVAMILNSNIKSNIQNLLSIFCLLLLFNTLPKKLINVQMILKYLSIIAKVYISLHFITIILDHPLFAPTSVSYDKYFLGSDNYSAFILIPLASFILLDHIMNKRKSKIETVFFLIVGFLCLIIPKAWTGLFSYGILLVTVAYKDNSKVQRWFTLRNVLILTVTVLVFIIVFNIQNYIGWLLHLIGKKGFSSREIIWPNAIAAFIKRPILGYGLLTNDQISSYILYGASHTHNYILEFLLDSGIIGSLFVFRWLSSVFKVNNQIFDKDEIRVSLLCFVSYFICSIFDFYITLIYFWLLVMFFDYLKICLQKESAGNRIDE